MNYKKEKNTLNKISRNSKKQELVMEMETKEATIKNQATAFRYALRILNRNIYVSYKHALLNQKISKLFSDFHDEQKRISEIAEEFATLESGYVFDPMNILSDERDAWDIIYDCKRAELIAACRLRWIREIANVLPENFFYDQYKIEIVNTIAS